MGERSQTRHDEEKEKRRKEQQANATDVYDGCSTLF